MRIRVTPLIFLFAGWTDVFGYFDACKPGFDERIANDAGIIIQDELAVTNRSRKLLYDIGNRTAFLFITYVLVEKDE
ncbi:hypothetical protein [Bradyrhizobium sp. JYMT SZCCT0428]|uniref:hypothetical protein n=1 Tax=Bradyrhizobium sp. JYMT SZCCT0428 TaxID=2807673 RepID=UPI001BA5AE01|nr:hypothetical protein [Bradyrhizobium sp. JYMT SZCCT0428]